MTVYFDVSPHRKIWPCYEKDTCASFYSIVIKTSETLVKYSYNLGDICCEFLWSGYTSSLLYLVYV